MEQVSNNTDKQDNALLNLRVAASIIFEISAAQKNAQGSEALDTARQLILDSYHALSGSSE